MARLSTTRLLVRPFEATDFEAVRSFRGDEKVMYYVTGAAETTEEVIAFLERTRRYAQKQPQEQYRFAIILASDARVIGGCGLDITDWEFREGEIGYHIHRDFWGQGIGTEVANALLHFAFEDLSLHRVFADCAAENTGSAGVMRKAGMRKEAHFRDNKRIADRWHDTLVYAILDSEWRAKRHNDDY